MKTEHFKRKLREKEFVFIAVGYFTFKHLPETVCTYTRIYLQKKMTKTGKKFKIGKKETLRRRKER
jgi:hypothetical protein